VINFAIKKLPLAGLLACCVLVFCLSVRSRFVLTRRVLKTTAAKNITTSYENVNFCGRRKAKCMKKVIKSKEAKKLSEAIKRSVL